MDRKNIEKLANTAEDRLLLAKLWDKLNAGMQRQICAATAFLSPREQQLAWQLMGHPEGLVAFGGYPEAERKMLVYLPEYLSQQWLLEEASPVVCLQAAWYEPGSVNHRDLLGALMGAGISRGCVGDICVQEQQALLFVTDTMAPFIMQELTAAGRISLSVKRLGLEGLTVPQPSTKELRDTVASLRLDCVLASAFRVGRTQAAQYVAAGRVSVDGLPCEKADKQINEGAKLSVRGLGKCRLRTVGSTTKKGRISILIDRYV